MAQDRDQSIALMNPVISLPIRQQPENLLTSLATMSFSGNTQLHEIVVQSGTDHDFSPGFWVVRWAK